MVDGATMRGKVGGVGGCQVYLGLGPGMTAFEHLTTSAGEFIHCPSLLLLQPICLDCHSRPNLSWQRSKRLPQTRLPFSSWLSSKSLLRLNINQRFRPRGLDTLQSVVRITVSFIHCFHLLA